MKLEFSYNDKPVSSMMSWVIIVTGLITATFIAIVFAALVVALYSQYTIIFVLGLVTLPLCEVVLRLLGRNGFFELNKHPDTYDTDDCWDDESDRQVNTIRWGFREHMGTFSLGFRPWYEAVSPRAS